MGRDLHPEPQRPPLLRSKAVVCVREGPRVGGRHLLSCCYITVPEPLWAAAPECRRPGPGSGSLGMLAQQLATASPLAENTGPPSGYSTLLCVSIETGTQSPLDRPLSGCPSQHSVPGEGQLTAGWCLACGHWASGRHCPRTSAGAPVRSPGPGPALTQGWQAQAGHGFQKAPLCPPAHQGGSQPSSWGS